MLDGGYKRNMQFIATPTLDHVRHSEEPEESETQDLRARMRQETGRSKPVKRSDRPAGLKFRRAPSGGNKRVCPNCGRIFGKGYIKCWYCKWEPWYIRYWYVTVAVLAVVGLMLTILLFRK
jgi:hypothetical protein